MGNWQLKEEFDGYVMGGNFKWNSISVDNSHTVTFSQDGQYQMRSGKNEGYQQLYGNLFTTDAGKLKVNTDCNTTTQTFTVSELTPVSLIIDQPVIEGLIRYKYTAVK
jgi:hypothetical protein